MDSRETNKKVGFVLIASVPTLGMAANLYSVYQVKTRLDNMHQQCLFLSDTSYRYKQCAKDFTLNLLSLNTKPVLGMINTISNNRVNKVIQSIQSGIGSVLTQAQQKMETWISRLVANKSKQGNGLFKNQSNDLFKQPLQNQQLNQEEKIKQPEQYFKLL